MTLPSLGGLADLVEVLSAVTALLGALVAFWSIRNTRRRYYREFKDRRKK